MTTDDPRPDATTPDEQEEHGRVRRGAVAVGSFLAGVVYGADGSPVTPTTPVAGGPARGDRAGDGAGDAAGDADGDAAADPPRTG